MCGTEYPEGGYSFVGADKGELYDWEETPYPEIEFMTLEQIIELAKENMVESVEGTIKSYYALKERMDYYALKERMEKKLNECKRETGISFDTGGELPF